MASAAFKLKLPPLVPGVKRSVWRRDDQATADADLEFAQTRMNILKRDRFTCRYCEFKSVPDRGRNVDPASRLASGYLEVHHLNDNHKNNQQSNLVSICPFCHQVHHIGFAAHEKAIRIIWLPWIEQADLNLLVNGLAVASSRKGQIGEEADNLMVCLQALDGPLIKNYGEEITDPKSFATALMGMHIEGGKKTYAKREKALAGIRILPNTAKFAEAVEWWSQTTWLPGEQWEKQWTQVYQQWMASYRSAV